MTRCPNCGSAIRIGAKFCTSCGFRLTTDASASAPAAGSSRSPFATTSSPAWRADSAAVDEPGAAVAAQETVVAQEVAPAASTTVDVEPVWTPAIHESSNVSEPVSAEVTTTITDESEPTVSEAEADANQQPGPSWYSPAAPNTSGPVSDDMIASLGGSETTETRSVDAPGQNEEDPFAALTPPAESVSTTYVWNSGEHQIEAVREPVAPLAPAPAGIEGGPLAEARSLAARLTEVLAAVSEGGSTASRPSAVSTVADEADVEALRSVVASAQERPRDVDVMLDLVLRAETIAAVIADRDQLLAALRGDGAPAESPAEESVSTDAAPSAEETLPTGGDDDDEPSTYPAWRQLP